MPILDPDALKIGYVILTAGKPAIQALQRRGQLEQKRYAVFLVSLIYYLRYNRNSAPQSIQQQ